MRESVHQFGKYEHLVGTLCIPDNKDAKSKSPCIVMLNAGLVYQAGPNRIYVEMARALALNGYCSFRFDLSGIGDSRRRRDAISNEKQILADIDEALAFIEEKEGINAFVLGGICTGADNTHKYSLTNPKIRGVIFLDGYGYKTFGYYLRYYLTRISNPAKLAKWIIRRVLNKNKHESKNELQEAKETDSYFWSMPPKSKTTRELKQLVDRRVCQLHIYTSNWQWCFNHKNQFKVMYKEIDFRGTAACVYYEHSDHTYTLMDDRRKLIETVTNWLFTNFP